MGFPGVQALSSVSLDVHPGEIHCILGENGAGKSTLIKALAGAIPHGPYSGVVEMDGEPVRFAQTHDATQRGIATIYQELSLFPRLTVAENIFLGRQPTLGKVPVIDHAKLEKDAATLLNALGIELDPQSQYNLARRLMRKDIIDLQRMDSFKKTKIFYEDVVMASFEAAYISFEASDFVVWYDDRWYPSISNM